MPNAFVSGVTEFAAGMDILEGELGRYFLTVVQPPKSKTPATGLRTCVVARLTSDASDNRIYTFQLDPLGVMTTLDSNVAATREDVYDGIVASGPVVLAAEISSDDYLTIVTSLV